jgi:hypothetical protein
MDLLERHGILNDFFDKLSPGQEILRVRILKSSKKVAVAVRFIVTSRGCR